MTKKGGHSGHHMSDEEKERIAKELYGKSYADLDTNQQKSVGGHYGGGKTHEMAEEHKK
ncbi:hypothetical protein GPECTOR_10g1064 [Gonium pectorale]|uniref:Uncharacterized protein n=1 Tax=Gonium pectorale TaxID=33097 RepID=A0A150GQG2_GONPE|nr:hypothetical protein GPECTOR_10g1064 [Gonium pectorale]|eukprot:KXZ52041.1 hypothetical protein GPECTOR_10g1064 [Gonium pectorale]